MGFRHVRRVLVPTAIMDTFILEGGEESKSKMYVTKTRDNVDCISRAHHNVESHKLFKPEYLDRTRISQNECNVGTTNIRPFGSREHPRDQNGSF